MRPTEPVDPPRQSGDGSLDSSARVVGENFYELRRFLQTCETDPRNALLGLDQARKRDREEVFAESHRLMHNFLAAAYSLKEHSIAVRGRVAPQLKETYESETARRFTQDGVAGFCQGLRNYSTHRRPIPLTISGQGMPPSTRTTLVIKRRNLEDYWSSWSSATKAWLRSSEEDIVLAALAAEYIAKVMAFQTWFRDEVRRVRESDLLHFRNKKEEYFLLFIETRLDARLADPDGSGPMGDRGLFLHIFDLSEFGALDKLPPGSQERAEAAHAMLARHFQIPDRVAGKLRQAYLDRRFFPS